MSQAPPMPVKRDYVASYIVISLFFAIGALVTVSWMSQSYLWLILSAGLALVSLAIAYMTTRATVVAAGVLVSVATWIAITQLMAAEVFNKAGSGMGITLGM